MAEYKYAKGRIAESIQFISQELKEFEEEYANRKWTEYQNDRKLQKLTDRTVENILTALIEVCGTVLTEEGISADNYSETLRRCGNYFNFAEEEQDYLGKLALQRNRLAHRYLNFRWQAIKMFNDQKELVKKLIKNILEREEKRLYFANI
jgi:uncharacterized protein YutE (UPF0331/DUF86 family)